VSNEYIFDAEWNYPQNTKILVLSVGTVEKGILYSTNDYDRMRKLFTNKDITIVGHNIWRADKPIIEKLLNIKIECKMIDTLPISWYLEFNRKKHGLEQWGEEFGIEKPKIEDWNNLGYKKYQHRCEHDVKINIELWKRLKAKLNKLYEGDYQRLIDYLNFKMYCAMLQEKSRWKLDIDKCTKGIKELTKEKEEKTKILESVMPRIPIKIKKTKPKKPFKQDGAWSATGKKWFKLLKEKGLPEGYNGEVEVINGYKEPNPGSHDQIKDWLYKLGWKPQTFKFVRNKETNEVKQIPQINLLYGQGICHSIKKLYSKEPNLEVLDGLSILSHRITLLDGFLRDVDKEGYVTAKIQGITNTMRFKHAVCVNLPGIDKAYGELIRGCLIASDDEHELCGSDQAQLEDRTKQHYLWQFDKDYVREMCEPGYDPHIDIAVQAGFLTKEQEERHKTGNFLNEQDKKEIKEGRKRAKPVNYGAVYNQQPKSLARDTGMPLKQAKELYEVYWKRNWAVKAVARQTKTKKEFGSMWLYNPVSKLWYSLRSEGDKFSTLNQGTGSYCFDIWVKHVLSKREQLTAQFHDELVLNVKKGYRKEVEQLIRWAIKETNKELRLNRELDIDVQFDNNYAGIH